MPDQQPQPTDLGSTSRKWMWLGLLTVAVLVAIVIAWRGAGLFLVMVAPPNAPIPSDAQEISHESPYDGRDTWTYIVPHDVPYSLDFYKSESATCDTAPACSSSSPECGQLKVQCLGTLMVSGVNILWQVDIVPIGIAGQESEWTLQRLIDWSGTADTLPELP